jgi:hypothetical protein
MGRFAKVQASEHATQPAKRADTSQPTPENIMNIAKNMEAIFVVAALAIGTFASIDVANATVTAPRAAVVAQADAAQMQTVVVHAKRLTAEQKAAL